MRFYTHIAFGLFFSGLLGVPFEFLPLLFVILGSVLPDIDYPFSFIGRLFPRISRQLYNTVGHRSVTHSVYVALALVISGFIFSDNPLLFGLTLGYISHLILDMGTPSGVQLAPPAGYAFTIFEGGVETGSKKEKLLAVIFIAGFILLLFFRGLLYSLIP